MKFTGSVVHYYLVREFGDVICDGPSRRVVVDYPLLYDASSDMSGHTVLVPEHERPGGGSNMKDTLCVCMGADAARAARDAGLAVVEVCGGVTFPRLYNYMQSVFVASEALDARLRAYVDSHAGFQPMLDACARASGFPCVIVDDRYRSVYAASPDVPSASGKDAGEGAGRSASADLLDSDAIDMFMASHGYGHMRNSCSVFTVPGTNDLLMKNVFSGGRLVGMVVMRYAGDTLSARFVRFFLGYLAPLIEEMYARLGSFDLSATGSGRVRLALGEAAGGNMSAMARLQAALAEDGHASDAEYAVLRIERSFTHEGAEGHDFLARRFERSWPHAYCFANEGNLYMLVDVDSTGSVAQQGFFTELPLIARDNLSKVGVSRPLAPMTPLDVACRQADGALACGSELHPTRWCYRFEEYAFSWLLLRMRQGEPLSGIVHPALAVLGRYDEEHEGELVATLSVFMRNRYNATAAARELFVARSTLLNRLERIQEITGFDFDDAEDRLYLALSLALAEQEGKLK